MVFKILFYVFMNDHACFWTIIHILKKWVKLLQCNNLPRLNCDNKSETELFIINHSHINLYYYILKVSLEFDILQNA